MGYDLAYFGAPDDKEAGRAATRLGGPLGWSVVSGTQKVGWFRRQAIYTELGPAYDGFATRGYEPVMVEVMGALLAGLPWSRVVNDVRYGRLVDEDSDEPEGVFMLTDELRDTLAGSTDEMLRAVVQPWVQSDEMRSPGWDDVTLEEHLGFLLQLRDLARRLQREGHQLYMYFSA